MFHKLFGVKWFTDITIVSRVLTTHTWVVSMEISFFFFFKLNENLPELFLRLAGREQNCERASQNIYIYIYFTSF